MSVDLLTSEPVCSDTTVLPLPSRQNHEWYTEQITVNIVQNILQPQKYTVYKWFETFDRCSVEAEWTRESGSVRQLSSWGSAAGEGQLRSGTEEVPISLWPWGEAPGWVAGRPLPDLLPTSWELLSAGSPLGSWLGHHLAAGPGSAVGPVPWFSSSGLQDDVPAQPQPFPIPREMPGGWGRDCPQGCALAARSCPATPGAPMAPGPQQVTDSHYIPKLGPWKVLLELVSLSSFSSPPASLRRHFLILHCLPRLVHI